MSVGKISGDWWDGTVLCVIILSRIFKKVGVLLRVLIQNTNREKITYIVVELLVSSLCIESKTSHVRWLMEARSTWDSTTNRHG